MAAPLRRACCCGTCMKHVVLLPHNFRALRSTWTSIWGSNGSFKGEILGRKLAVTLMPIKPSDATGARNALMNLHPAWGWAADLRQLGWL